MDNPSPNIEEAKKIIKTAWPWIDEIRNIMLRMMF